MRQLIRRSLLTVLGLAIFAVGEYLTIQANIGLNPWGCLSMGASMHVPLSYGVVHVCISLLIVLIDILLGERIGLGTLLDALVVGLCVDLYKALGLCPLMTSVWAGVHVLVIGLIFMAYGQFIYMRQGLGCGPRDSLMVGIGRRFSRLPIGVVQTGVLILALGTGCLLGGPVGIGTLISVFGIGIAMQLVFRIFRFEPRNVRHEHLAESMQKALRSSNDEIVFRE